MIIQITRWFIRKNNARIFDNCTRNGYALTFSTTQLRGITTLIPCKSYFGKRLAYVAIIFHATQIERKQNVIVNCQFLDKVVILKNKSNVRIAVVAHFALVKMRNIVSVYFNLTTCDFIQTTY